MVGELHRRGTKRVVTPPPASWPLSPACGLQRLRSAEHHSPSVTAWYVMLQPCCGGVTCGKEQARPCRSGDCWWRCQELVSRLPARHPAAVPVKLCTAQAEAAFVAFIGRSSRKTAIVVRIALLVAWGVRLVTWALAPHDMPNLGGSLIIVGAIVACLAAGECPQSPQLCR